MPIPKPTAQESEEDFMGRCMTDSTMLSEYSDRDQRVAVCLDSFKNPKKEEDMEVEHDILDLECEYKEMDTDDDGSFEGYASVFNNKDLGNDVIRQGAFTKTITGRKASSIKLLYQHKTDEPIGVIDSLEEDKRGLKIKGR